MAKLMTLVKNPPGMEHAAFRFFWRDEFLPAVLELETAGNHIYKAVHNHVLPTSIREEEHIAANSWAGISSYRSEEHTSELQSLMRISYAVFCLTKKNNTLTIQYVHIDKNKKLI